MSGSGNSPNVINAIDFAKTKSIKTSVISGRGGGKASKMVDHPIIVNGTSNFPGQTGKNDNNFHIEDFQNSSYYSWSLKTWKVTIINVK